MKLEHIALTVGSREEIDDFYCGILGMKKVRDFVLKADVAGKLFGIKKEMEVSFLEKDGLHFELFVTGRLPVNPVGHTCISIPGRDAVIRLARERGYKVIRVERPEFDLVFISDKAGNRFELRVPAG